MSTEPNNADETKELTPPKPEEEVKKLDEKASSSPKVEPGKKKRKLNDGSSSNADEQSSTGFFSSVTNFLSGSWLWSSPAPKKTEANAKPRDKLSEKEPAEPDKNTKKEEDSSAELKVTSESTTDKKEVETNFTGNEEIAEPKAPIEMTVEEDTQKELGTVTNSSGDSDEADDDNVQQSEDEESDDDKRDEMENLEPSTSETKIVIKSESPKAVAINMNGSKKRRRLS